MGFIGVVRRMVVGTVVGATLTAGVASTGAVAATTQEVRERFYDGVEVRREMGRDETFYAIDKARDLLGYEPEHSWRDVLDDPGAS